MKFVKIIIAQKITTFHQLRICPASNIIVILKDNRLLSIRIHLSIHIHLGLTANILLTHLGEVI